MEYKNVFLTKLISFLLVLTLVFSLFACGDTQQTSSNASQNNESVQSSKPDENTLSLDEAKSLITKDKFVIELFVCGTLCTDKTSANYTEVAVSNSYHDYSIVNDLLNSTYLSAEEDGDVQFFANYPVSTAPALKNIDGITHALYHSGSDFNDFIDMSTVFLTRGEADGEILINAKTLSGREVVLKAVSQNGLWRLEHSLFRVYSPEEQPKPQKPVLSGIGSMAEFSGEVLIIELFVSDNGAKFTLEDDEDEAVFHQKISASVDYIASYAKAYGADVNVTYEKAYFEHDGTIGSGELPFDLIFGETGFGSLQNFAENAVGVNGYDNYFFAVCFKRDCEPFFRAYENTKETQFYFAERVFVGLNTAESDICFALLSVLGAYNYRENLYDAYTEALYQAYFPNDIMSSDTLAGTELTPVTAYCCGMTEDLKPLYRVFLNNQEKSEEQ